MAKILNLPHSVSLLLLVVALANASVTWKRVTKPARLATQISTTAVVPSTTKSTVTWRRSTKSRRSTTHREEPPPAIEEDDIDTADSKEQASLAHEDADQDQSIRPLVPGSRPGFWFDSSRRKKPSALLRPGARRNSLFPNKASTQTVANSITENVTPISIVPRTTSSLATTPKPSSPPSKLKAYGRNRSTKSPIAYRRKLKTTKPSKVSSTTIAPVSDDFDVTVELPQEPEEKVPKKDEREREDETSSDSGYNDNSYEEKTKNKPPNRIQTPRLGIRRRPKNGTLLSWKKGGERFNSRTTSTPRSTQLSTSTTTTLAPVVTTAKIYERLSRRPSSFPRIRTRTRTNRTTSSPKVSWSKDEQVTTTQDTPTTKFNNKKRLEKIRGSSNYVRNRNAYKNRVKTTPIPEESEEESKEESKELEDDSTTTVTPPEYEIISTTEVYDTKRKTTVEPFYITRDYGQLVTAIATDHWTTGYIPTRTTQSPITTTVLSTKLTDFPTTNTAIPTQTTLQIVLDDELYANDTIEDSYEILQHPEEPQYTAVNETLDKDVLANAVEENFESVDLKPIEIKEEFKQPDASTLETTLPPTEATFTTVSQRYLSTTARPSITFPTISHTINPGTNAYVVWSVGQGGSGWSYEKQGEQVKWSAQNSQAVGDSWSVQGKEEKIVFDHTLWKPTRNASRFFSDRKKNENKVSVKNHHNNLDKYEEPVTFIPSVPYRNETFLKIKTTPETYSFPPLTDTDISQLSSDLSNFTSTFYQNTGDSFSSNNVNGVPLNENFALNPETSAQFYYNGTSGFNPNTGGKENPYSIYQNADLNVPYIAEIRDTYNDVPNFETTLLGNASNAQDQLTEEQDNTGENLQPAIPYKLPDISYDLGYEFNLPKSTYPPYLTDIPSYGGGIFSDGLLDHGFQGVGQQIVDFNGLPPELAKAVVDAKRWTVVGSGGTEGWSLLGEDGQLEWKIHNIDGKWTVTSADELVKMPLQIPDSSQSTQEEEQPETERPNAENLNGPKIWTLEDDYEKWRVLSSEGGIKIGSPAKRPNGEYDYDHSEENQDDDYYEEEEDEDDYNDAPDNFTPYPFNENYEDRPLWGTSQMIPNHPDNRPYNYPPYGSEVESINTKEDAIAAWKSLLVNHGNWKLSEANKRQDIAPKPPSSEYHQSYPPVVNSEWKVSSQPIPKPQRNDENIYGTEVTATGNHARTDGKEVEGYKSYHTPQSQKTSLPGIKELGNNVKLLEENKENTPVLHKKDHSKIQALINKLENIQKEAKGRAVIDLSQLLKLIKSKRNSTSGSSKNRGNPEIQSKPSSTEIFSKQNKQENANLPFVQSQQDSADNRLALLIQNLKKTSISEKSINDLKNYIENLEDKGFNSGEDGTVNRYRNKPTQSSKTESQDFGKEERITPIFDQKKHHNDKSVPIGNYNFNSGVPANLNKHIHRESENANNQRRSDLVIEGKRNRNKETKVTENYKHLSNLPSNSGNRQIPKESDLKNNKKKQDVEIKEKRTHNRGLEPLGNHKFSNGMDSNSRSRYTHQEKEERISNQRNSDVRYEERRVYNDKREFDELKTSHNYPPNDYNVKKHFNKAPVNDRRFPNGKFDETEPVNEYRFTSKEQPNARNQQNYDYLDRTSLTQRKPDLTYEEKKTYHDEAEDSYKFVQENKQRYTKSKSRRKQNRPRTTPGKSSKTSAEILSDQERFSDKINHNPEEFDYPLPGYSKSQNSKEYEYSRSKYSSTRQRKKQQSTRRKNPPSEKFQQHRLRSSSRAPDRKFDSSEELIVNVRDQSHVFDDYEQKRRTEENVYEPPQNLQSRKTRRPSKRRTHKHSHSPPVVLSSETEIEDEEDGSKKSRKIIVIDYAGKQKKKSPIDRKDLELIIRNVKNRRSELMEENPSEKKTVSAR
ncbi:uncharacterized protein TNCT_446061 [Trichonephila clavata]|uniref:Uncharacterized protein n=1 Tax=Trichonephila clavata TaxID=2740835 RepID=A0A8X6IMT0_TRICU|nr:uncharacterized protein TNCT_446061 [Trichonephila clavata]